MPPPSQLSIATSAVSRLLKEEASYREELLSQEAQVRKLEESIKNGGGDEDENAEFMLKQNKTALEQTRGVFGPLRQRIDEAVAKLEDQIAQAEETGASEAAAIDTAKGVLADAKAAAKTSA